MGTCNAVLTEIGERDGPDLEQSLNGLGRSRSFSSAAEAESDDTADVLIMDMAQKGLNFHQHRKDALLSPDRALTRLDEYATLSLKIVRAENLIAADTGMGWRQRLHMVEAVPKSDPYVDIYVDDVMQMSTHRIDGTLNPQWNWEGAIPILNAGSFVRLQVNDYDFGTKDDPLGFVEFPVAEVPLDRPFRGWLTLSGAEELNGTVAERWSAAQESTISATAVRAREYLQDPFGMLCAGKEDEEDSEEVPTTFGHVLVELQLTLAKNGTASDEWYAHCLPLPIWKRHAGSSTGDAQRIYDRTLALVETLLNNLTYPFVDSIIYVLAWREFCTSFYFFSTLVFVSILPQYFLSVCFASAGVLLVLLRSPARRRSISANPNSVLLNDDGFALVAHLESTPAMATFLRRVISTMQGRVLNPAKLLDFAAFSFLKGKPVVSYAELRRQLRITAASDPTFLRFQDAPLKPGSLVRKGAKVGEVLACDNPALPASARKYTVRFDHEIGKRPKPGKTEKEIVAGDDLDLYLNLRWMSYAAVRAVTPDVVVDSLTDIQPTIEDASLKVERAVEIAHSTVSWKYPCRTLALALVCFSVACRIGINVYSGERSFAAAGAGNTTQTEDCPQLWGIIDGGWRNTTLGGGTTPWQKPVLCIWQSWTSWIGEGAIAVFRTTSSVMRILGILVVVLVFLWNAKGFVFVHQACHASKAIRRHKAKNPGRWPCCREELLPPDLSEASESCTESEGLWQ